MSALGSVFSITKVVDSRFLNAIGVQPFRMVAARCLYRLRRARADPGIASRVTELARDGIVIWPDFLAPDQLTRVREEFDRLTARREHTSVEPSGPNVAEFTRIREFAPHEFPEIRAFYAEPRLQAIASAAERRPVPEVLHAGVAERLTQGTGRQGDDPQGSPHSDTYFSSHKLWFYVDPVTRVDGPLTFVKGSHRLTWRRLVAAYRTSREHATRTGPSLRVGVDEAASLAMRETVVICPANTLVVANTCGYHRRLQGEPGRVRRALHITLRADPFRAHRIRGALEAHGRLHAFLKRLRGGRSLPAVRPDIGGQA